MLLNLWCFTIKISNIHKSKFESYEKCKLQKVLIYVRHALHDHLQNQLQHLIVLFKIDYTTCFMCLYKFNHSESLINKLLEGRFLKNKGSVQTAEE